MQQIQTPTGPKLIAVPVGQTLGTASFQTAAATTAFHPSTSLFAAATSSTTTSSPVFSVTNSTVISSISQPAPATITQQQQQQHQSLTTTALSIDNAAAKKKKSKKAKKKGHKASLDLGELMKDVGLDLENFGMEDGASGSGTGSDDPQPQPQQVSLPTQPTLVSADGLAGLDASSSQLLAQIQQPLPLQSTTTGQLHLVQGPDGQFMLQSAPTPAPTIIAQTVRSH